MKSQLKAVQNYFYVAIALLLFVVSCKKTETKVEEKFLDVNINFTGVAPETGAELFVNLFYKEVSGKAMSEMIPDELIKVKLTNNHIDQGLRVTFENFRDDVSVAYVSAYVDMDGDGKASIGDLGIFHNDLSFEEVVDENIIPQNLNKDYAITINLNRVILFEEPEEPEVPGIVKDIDGNEYKTVIIGDQEWMAENLKVTRYRNGDPILTGLSNTDWSSATDGAYSIYPFDAAGVSGVYSEAEMIASYGLLYNWHAVNDERGIAPEGWRVATDEDWKTLEKFAGMTQAKADAEGWRRDNDEGAQFKSSTNWNGTDDYEFSVLPSGSRVKSGNYEQFGNYGYIWTSSEGSATHAHKRSFQDSYLSIHRGTYNKNDGYSIRCVRAVK